MKKKYYPEFHRLFKGLIVEACEGKGTKEDPARLVFYVYENADHCLGRLDVYRDEKSNKKKVKARVWNPVTKTFSDLYIRNKKPDGSDSLIRKWNPKNHQTLVFKKQTLAEVLKEVEDKKFPLGERRWCKKCVKRICKFIRKRL